MNPFVQVFIRNDDAFYDSIGDARTSCIDARDVARVAFRVLTEPGHEGKAYDLSGPEAISHHEAAATLTRISHSKRYYRPSSRLI